MVLAGCDNRGDARTPGQKLDAALATTEKKLDGLKDEARSVGRELRETASGIDTRVSAAAGDAGITARVKAKLAVDAELNALKINVDTSAGRVTLKGTAPSAAARERATTLAKGAEGVLGVDNQLLVAPTPAASR